MECQPKQQPYVEGFSLPSLYTHQLFFFAYWNLAVLGAEEHLPENGVTL